MVSFARSRTANRFFNVSEPAFAEANKVFDLYRKRPQEKGQNSWQHPQKSNLERAGKQLFDIGELGPADSLDLHSY